MNAISLVDISLPCHSSDRRSAGVSTQNFADRRIINCLQAMNMTIDSISRDEFLHGKHSHFHPLVIFIFDDKELLDIELKSKLHQYMQNNGRVNICLLPFASDMHDIQSILDFDDFIYWPCSLNELKLRLKPWLSKKENSYHNSLTQQQISTFSKLNLCGQSSSFVHVLQLIEKISQHQATVLVQGETGTGKENAARAIHYLGERSSCAFVPINCATIPDELLESELFGHEKGAFTDAKQAKEGLVALANGGTLFLDEVDSLSTKAQAALLSFLQTREYRPVGSKHLLRANVRVIAATNADLKQLANQKRFREDLYFRLHVFNLVMPPLRERKDDLSIIAENLVGRFSKDYNLPIKLLSQQSLRYLQQQSWPGNVREFENTLLRSFLLSNGDYLDIQDETSGDCVLDDDEEVDDVDSLQLATKNSISFSNSISFQDAKAIAIESFEKNYLSHVLSVTQGNVTLAARIAGKERRALGKLLQKYQIDKYQYR